MEETVMDRMLERTVCPHCGKHIAMYDGNGNHIATELHYQKKEHLSIQSISYRVYSFSRLACIWRAI
jgi:hypothetical protein